MVLINVSEICSALKSSEGEAQHTQMWEHSETETIPDSEEVRLQRNACPEDDLLTRRQGGIPKEDSYPAQTVGCLQRLWQSRSGTVWEELIEPGR